MSFEYCARLHCSCETDAGQAVVTAVWEFENWAVVEGLWNRKQEEVFVAKGREKLRKIAKENNEKWPKTNIWRMENKLLGLALRKIFL